MQQQLDFGLLVFFLATIMVDRFPIFGFLCDYANAHHDNYLCTGISNS